MIAVKRLQSLFWVLFVALGALSAYLVSLKVATERNELMRVRAQIASARGDIRYLETEFSARASMRQLERWASQDFHYSALGADRYLTDERQLAHLDGLQPNGPEYAPQPVLVAMIGTGNPAQMAPTEESAPVQLEPAVAAPAPEKAAPVSTPAIRVAAAEKPKAEKSAKSKASTAPQLAQADKPARPATTSRKAERMAMLDAQLLDSRSMGAIGRSAR
ncbi:MAG: colicin transporter [Sphingomonadaceae bacterium]|jgi:hypothetical protein